jgi:prepilin-type N-terminal cleavage/methylation domain-containing protein
MIEPVLSDQCATGTGMEGRVMRAPHSEAAARGAAARLTATTGFSLVELLITVVIAGIIFAAMVPFFANALGTTARDARRNDTQLIAQDRIEQVRLLNYGDITQSNLNNPPSPTTSFGDGRFGTHYQLTRQRPYTVQYTVVPQVNAEQVTVSVSSANDSYTTTMQTIVKDPAPGIVTTDTGGPTGPLPTTNLSITVSFKNWTEVVTGSTKGVWYTRTDTSGNTITSTHVWPTSSSHTVSFTGLDGGSSYTYTVYCYTTFSGVTQPFASPPFRLLKSARLKFDTNPGGS